ncbi:MAG: NAD(P)H-quinone oxidoreductase subunit M [Cyanobacteria bacterium J06614_10]
MLLKSTTRHILIYAATIEADEIVPSDQKLTIDVDPENEFNWSEEALTKVYREFDRLVDEYAGEALTDYTLRRIGSDLEHFVRALLQSGEISYNLQSRVLNYSMGLPRVVEAEKEKTSDAAGKSPASS